MRIIRAYTFAVLLILVGSVLLTAQSASSESVKWRPIIGPQKELIAYMPDGYKLYADETPRNFGLKNGQPVTVKRAVKVARLVNRALLIWNFHEADGKRLFGILSEIKGLAQKESGVAGQFEVKGFAGKHNSHYARKQFFISKGRLYEMTAYSPTEDDPIVAAFFASVRIADGDSYLAPNAAQGETSTALPRIKEVVQEKASDDRQFNTSDLDRDAIVLFQPGFSVESVGPIGDGNVTVTARLDASGVVKDVKHNGTAPMDFRLAFSDSVRRIVFIPAEKDGKLVSVDRVFKLEMNSEIRGIPPGAVIR
jgi:hypothetical protein